VGTLENSQRRGRTTALPIGADGLPVESAMSVPKHLPHPAPRLRGEIEIALYASSTTLKMLSRVEENLVKIQMLRIQNHASLFN
jgi:hypothetical protein